MHGDTETPFAAKPGKQEIDHGLHTPAWWSSNKVRSTNADTDCTINSWRRTDDNQGRSDGCCGSLILFWVSHRLIKRNSTATALGHITSLET